MRLKWARRMEPFFLHIRNSPRFTKIGKHGNELQFISVQFSPETTEIMNVHSLAFRRVDSIADFRRASCGRSGIWSGNFAGGYFLLCIFSRNSARGNRVCRKSHGAILEFAGVRGFSPARHRVPNSSRGLESEWPADEIHAGANGSNIRHFEESDDVRLFRGDRHGVAD